MAYRIGVLISDGELGLGRLVSMIRRRGFRLERLEAVEVDPPTTGQEETTLVRAIRVSAEVRGQRSIEWLAKLIRNQPGFELEAEPVSVGDGG